MQRLGTFPEYFYIQAWLCLRCTSLLLCVNSRWVTLCVRVSARVCFRELHVHVRVMHLLIPKQTHQQASKV